MKLTLEIPDQHAPALLALLANLMPVTTEPVADPCPDHPELPLMPACSPPTPELIPVSEWAAKWIEAGGDVPPTPEQLKAIQCGARTPETVEPDPWDLPPYTDPKPAGFAANSEGKLEMIALDENNPDPTLRVLPWPTELSGIALPEIPEGKTRWVYRGKFEEQNYDVGDDRIIYYRTAESEFDHWFRTAEFSTCLHHIEAI